ncbi:DUF4363 family protein [Allofournierella sp.]|uniref:DUF4363 family protein n=1 Tax=Allofournierella sp. TaxID=1940256 RepID=UPI003AB7787E
MKRVYAAVWILLFLALVILASSWLVHDTNITMLETLSQLEWQASEGDFTGAQKTIGRLNQYYKSREHFMALFIKRDYLGSTAVCLGGLSAYAAEENLQDLRSEIGKAKAQIKMMDHLFFSML